MIKHAPRVITIRNNYIRAMLKDIIPGRDADTGIAIVNEWNEELEKVWNVYFINAGDVPVRHVLVTCKGYGEWNGTNHETSLTRYFIGDVDAQGIARIEPVNPDLFVLNNEYFITFYRDGNMIDKKIVFEANSISEETISEIASLNKQGVLLT